MAGAPIHTVSGVADLKNEELRPTIDQYFRGTGMEAVDRIKLLSDVDRWTTRIRAAAAGEAMDRGDSLEGSS